MKKVQAETDNENKVDLTVGDTRRVVEVGRLLLSVLTPTEVQALLAEGDREHELNNPNGDRIHQHLSPSAPTSLPNNIELQNRRNI